MERKQFLGFGKTLGEVDMFGYDSKPTSSERKVKLANEMISITSIEVILGKAEEFNKLYISKLNA